MKKALCLATLALSTLTVTTVRADTAFTVEPIVALEAKKNPDPSVEGTLLSTFGTSKFGVSGFYWVMKDWAEAYVGPTYSPVKQLTLNLGLGVEQDGHGNLQGRYAAGFSLNPNDTFAFSGTMEVNTRTFRGDTSGIWYDVLATATLPLFSRLTVGVHGRRFIGIGPHVQLNVPEAHTKVWLLWAAGDPERSDLAPFSSVLLGLTLGF